MKEKLSLNELRKIQQNYYNIEQLILHTKLLERAIKEIDTIVSFKSMNQKNWDKIQEITTKTMEHI